MLGPIMRIEHGPPYLAGPFGVTRAAGAPMGGPPPPPIEAGSSAVSATVSVVFAIADSPYLGTTGIGTAARSLPGRAGMTAAVANRRVLAWLRTRSRHMFVLRVRGVAAKEATRAQDRRRRPGRSSGGRL
jgi:hypothetical protein